MSRQCSRQDDQEPCNHRHARVHLVTIGDKDYNRDADNSVVSIRDKTTTIEIIRVVEAHFALPHGKFPKPGYLRRHGI